METDHWMISEVEVLDTKVGHLLNPRTAVVEEQQQGSVPQGQRAIVRKTAQKILHLVPLQERCRGRRRPFHRDRRHPLADAQHLRCPSGDVLEEGVQRGQPLVAGADVVASVLLEVAKEADYPLEGQIVERQPGDLASLVVGNEEQKEPDRVPVAAHRRRTQPFHSDEMADEEGLS
jgi:hypothetical protein